MQSLQTLYCSGVSNLSMGRPRDVFIAVNDSLLANTTDVRYRLTDDQRHDYVERRLTETVYLVIRHYVYHGVTPVSTTASRRLSCWRASSAT